MATAKIIFQQNGDGYTTPTSRDDLVLGLPVTMLNQNNTGAVSWAWVMVDRPNGSSATIASPTASTTTFTPDVVGTYLIHLSVNAGAATDQRGAAVKTANLHYRIPAATETTEYDGYRGWATATNAALKVLDDGYTPPSSIPSFQTVYNSSTPSSFVLSSSNGGLQIHDAFTPIGTNLFEVDAYGAGTKFLVVAATATSISNNLLITGSNFIGVNTPSPLYPVHVTTVADNYSFIQTRGTVSGGLYARTAATQGFGIGSVSNDPLLFFTNNTPSSPGMVLSTGGAVGIGITAPTSQLHVVGTGHFTGAVALDAGFTSSAASSMSNFKITSLATPTVGTDAANKAYVDAAVGGAAATLQSAYTASIPATILLNSTSNGIIVQDVSGHLGSGLNGGRTPLFKIDAYNSTSNYLTVYRAGEELNREAGITIGQTTGAAIGVTYDAFWGSGASDIYVGGYDVSGSKQQLAHYNGTAWSVITTYPGVTGDTVNAIYGFAANDLYIGTMASGGGPGGIWHSTTSGASWGTIQYSTKGINTIWGPNSTNIYAGVQDNSGIVLFSNGGGTWAPTTGGVGTRFINSIWGASASEFWVATSDSIWHTTNSGTSFTSQFDTNTNSSGFFSIGVSVNWKSIWGSSSSNIYAVGTSGGKGYIAYYNGSIWTLQVQAYADPLSVGFTNVYGTNQRDIYVCGGQALLYSVGNGAWTPQPLSASLLSGGVSLNAVWAPVYNQWYIGPSNTSPVSVISLAPQGANITAPGIATLGELVTNSIASPDLGLNTTNTLTLTAFTDANHSNPSQGFIFNTTQPVYTAPANNYLASFQAAGTEYFRIRGDGYLQVPAFGGLRYLGTSTDIISWTASQFIVAEQLQVNATSTTTGLATFLSHVNVDGYTIDISGGAVTNDALVYNGTKFVAQSSTSSVNEVSNSFNVQLTTDATPQVTSNYTAVADGNFVCYMYYRVDGYSTDVEIDITWTDGYGAQTLNILPTTTKPVGSYSVASVYVQEVAGGTISITFTAGTGVGTNLATNVFVSSTIVQV